MGRKSFDGRFSSLTHPEFNLSKSKIPAAPLKTVEMLPPFLLLSSTDLRAGSLASLFTTQVGGGSVSA